MTLLLSSNLTTYHAIDSVRIDQVQQKVESLHSLIDTSNGVICNEISSANNYLTVLSISIAVIGIILTIVGFFIGRYINSLYKKVRIIEKTVAEKEQGIKSLSQTVQETSDNITNNIGEIYNRLRKEELFSIIKRLEQEPLDITHCISMLLSNELDDSWFENLYHAYQKLIASGKADDGKSWFRSSYRDNYLIVFFQHYLYRCILAADMREDIIPFLETGCELAFERDIIKCTKDLCQALNEPILDNSVEILYKYLIAVNNSEFKNLAAIKDIINTELVDRSTLRQAVDRCTSNNIYLELFDNKQPIDDEQ